MDTPPLSETPPAPPVPPLAATTPKTSPSLGPLSRDALLDPKKQRFANQLGADEDYNEIPTYPLRPSYRDFHAQLRPASQTVVFDGCPDNPYRPASVPIYQTATFEQPGSTEFGAYDYTRSGNPTRTALERQIAMLENAHAAFAFGTGMSALNSVCRLLKSGDTIVIGSDIYGGMHRLVSRVTSLYDVRVISIDTWNLDAVRRLVESNDTITLLHMETPSNPLMRVTDIRALSQILANKNILLSVDSTMMTPHLQKPLNHGADIVVHSMTKFFGGHSDVMGGVVCVATEELAKRISFFQNAEGTGLSPFDSWLFLRGIKTMAIRVERAQQNARAIASYLLRHPVVKEVFYAGLEPSQEDFAAHNSRSIDYKVHMGQAKGGGAVISLTTGSVETSRKIIDALRLFKLTVSFGSCNSLCEMPATLSHASIPANERTLPEDMVRLAIGIEDVNDLLEDLQRALSISQGKETTSAVPELLNLGASTSAASNASVLHQMHTSDRTKPDLPTTTPSKASRRPTERAATRKSREDVFVVQRNHVYLAAGVAVVLAAMFLSK